MAKRKSLNMKNEAQQRSETERCYFPQIRIMGDKPIWMNSGILPYESESQAEAIAKGFAKGWLGVAEWRSARVGADLNDPGEAPIVESDWDAVEEHEAHHELEDSTHE